VAACPYPRFVFWLTATNRFDLVSLHYDAAAAKSGHHFSLHINPVLTKTNEINAETVLASASGLRQYRMYVKKVSQATGCMESSDVIETGIFETER